MPIGGGKYEMEMDVLRAMTDARGVVMLVIEGHSGSSFEAQLQCTDDEVQEVALKLVSELRIIAAKIEADLPAFRREPR